MLGETDSLHSALTARCPPSQRYVTSSESERVLADQLIAKWVLLDSVSMNNSNMKCPKCGEGMGSGILLDRGTFFKASALPQVWADAVHDTATGTTPDPGAIDQHQVDAYRCVGCGFIELYAGMGNE